MRHLEAREIVAGNRWLGCNVERPACGQFAALSGKNIWGVIVACGKKGDKPELWATPPPILSQALVLLFFFVGFSLLEFNVGPGDGSPPGAGRTVRGGADGLYAAALAICPAHDRFFPALTPRDAPALRELHLVGNRTSSSLSLKARRGVYRWRIVFQLPTRRSPRRPWPKKFNSTSSS